MKSFPKNKITPLLVKGGVGGGLILFLRPSPAHAAVWGARCAVNTVATIQGFECLFANILEVIVSLAGIVFFIMFLNGGFQYLFSSNDPKKVAVASNTLTMAFIGLAGVAISWLILNFIHTFTGVDVTQFAIPGP
jgi:hypothetical protein